MKSVYFYIHLVSILALCGINGGGSEKTLSRVVPTVYGSVQGYVRHLGPSSHDLTLSPVEVFLGVPYAAPPTGQARFSPSMSPLPWDGTRRCLEPPPACPQPMVGSAGDRQEASGRGGRMQSPITGRPALLAALRPLLQYQSEDCLYLNIYTPQQRSESLAVMVYIHGESFTWGSGSLYDGSILASYGQVVLVTINYRLGPLGFLNLQSGKGSDGPSGNQGLMDQLAALEWIHHNIHQFGGDPQRVTLVGHSTGAVAVNYLLVSPVVAPGMFQRVILMSGSALSSWASVADPTSTAQQLAEHHHCAQGDTNTRWPEVLSCLQDVSAQDLVNTPLRNYQFLSTFGPSVDGVVIPHDFNERLTR
ncbi:unnamed protein product, partial [Meganyctiphanes norvegica]